MNSHAADEAAVLRAEIEQTRAELSEAVDALSDKFDVKHRAAARIDAVTGAVSDSASKVARAGSEQTRHVATAAGDAVSPIVEKARPLAVTANRNRNRIALIAGAGAVVLVLLRVARR